jgi:radical SAM protein with 4Fe4S-binding SPASM domain
MEKSKDIHWFDYNELFDLAIKKPEFAQLYLTNNCVQNCFFCFNGCNVKYGFPDLGLDSRKHIIKKLVELWVTGVNLSGWEVFLYKNIDELISFIKDAWIERITINTTWLIDITKYNFSCFDEVVFSIHWTPDIHNATTGRKWNYEMAMKNYKKFKEKKNASTIVWINTVITEKSIRQIDSIYANHKKLWSDYIAFNLEINRDNIQDLNPETVNIVDNYFKFINSIPLDKIKFRHGMKHLIWKRINDYEEKIPLPDCAAGKFKLVVNYKWDVYPCVYFQNNEFYCGNLLKDDIFEIWSDGKWFKKFRDLIYSWTDKGCVNCIKRYKCFSWCLAWRFYNLKTGNYEKDIRCGIGSSFIGNWSDI